MLRILIIDDEAPARNRLRRMLVDVPAVHVVGEAATGQEALGLISVKEPVNGRFQYPEVPMIVNNNLLPKAVIPEP